MVGAAWIRTAHWMYIRAPKPELYDLDNDPSELKNVIVTHPQGVPRPGSSVERPEHRRSWRAAGKTSSSQMDRKTAEQLSSLGYIPGSEGNISLEMGEGADSKDRVAVLNAFERVAGPASEKFLSRQDCNPGAGAQGRSNESFSVLHVGQAIYRSRRKRSGCANLSGRTASRHGEWDHLFLAGQVVSA